MRWQPPTITIILSFLTTITFNSLGWLQISEHKLYDFYLTSRPQESPEQKIVIVGLDEQDIEKFGFPLSDDILAKLLTKIKAQNPRVIGLDLYRNVNIGDRGSEKLDAIFSSTPQLIGVEKADGGNSQHQSISPPNQLEKLGQTGASEIIEDGANRIVRRGYLYVQQSNQDEMLPSFGLAVALKYLEAENIFPSGYGKKSWLRLGNAIFPLLQPNRLFYYSLAVDNYQTIINYRSTKKNFSQIRVSEVLENKITPNFFEDKIVFMGTTAETIQDIYRTPYSYDSINYNFTYGVEIHASLTSQIINAALNDRVIIKLLPVYWQYGGVVLLLVVASLGSWYMYTKNFILSYEKITVYIAYSILNLAITLTIGYCCLLLGWWIPTVTSLVIILSNNIWIYIFIRLEQLKKASFILEQKVKERTKALEEAQKKILSQEKLAIYQKFSQHIAHEIKNKTNIIGLNLQNSQTDLEELQLIIEDNSFIFEEIVSPEVRSPQELTSNLNDKLLRIQLLNEKVTLIINEIYERGIDNNNATAMVVPNVDINELLDAILSDALQICEIKYDYFKVMIARDYEKNIKKITCTLSDLERALDNIISNAIYHLYKKSTKLNDYQPILSVTTQNKSNLIEITIKDNGTGIPTENLDKIFQIFWTTKSSGESMGLGLHFAKELIEKYNGKISVASKENEYTEFTVTLPV